MGDPFYKCWFFSNLVGEEGSRIPGVKDSRVCFLRYSSAILKGIDTTDFQLFVIS